MCAWGFKLLFTGKLKINESNGSFLSFGDIFFKVPVDWKDFWKVTALISLAVACTNLLPIPALDGGDILLILFEAITGRKPGEKFLKYTLTVGSLLILIYMVLGLGLDFWRYLFKHG